jgi:hypothetical protein
MVRSYTYESMHRLIRSFFVAGLERLSHGLLPLLCLNSHQKHIHLQSTYRTFSAGSFFCSSLA